MEFPTVEESRKPRIKLNEDLSSGVRGDDQEGSRTDEVQVELSNLGSNNSYCDQSSNTEREAILPASSMSSRNRKRKDPIQIDLMNLIKTQPSRCNRGQGEKGGMSKVGRWVQKGDSRVWYSGNQLDASNPERKRGKKKEVPKKKKVTVLKNAILEERALRQKLRASREQTQDVNVQPESSQEQVDGIAVVNGDDEMTADSWVKRTAPDRAPSKTKESVDLCVTGTDVFEEVAGGGNFKKAGDLNITEILDLTQHVQEKLSLSTDDKAKILLQNISHVPENAQEAIKTTGMQEDDCTVVLPESPKHGCTDVIQRFFVHSRRFREYCDNSLTVPLNSAVKLLLKDIVKFQDRQYHRDPVKAFAKRRYVLGFREAKKHLQLKRLKLIVVAPDLEVAKVKGGIDDTIAQLKEDSTAQGVPCLFALSRRELGFVTFRKVGVSSIGICSYEGSEENFKNVMEHLTEARRHYKEQTRLTLTAGSLL
ncbi:selenocysteine insertion sequence-binding protein 2 isoform X2 [Zootermopsis nevadensis]|uniref:selenocysteine insertion sequence-binding protein 2 isoform X2 n=1 Tax=Zootermopsis nevadensis TaxID=136037 RepID=UPI000B8E46CC|nr:selenocysteine insertion sequence-binding protein 2 isoform X2 [Zootermopsis nevadensis]